MIVNTIYIPRINMLQSKTITVNLMISSYKSVIQKLQECREEIIFSDIVDRVKNW